jgi:hypothetical protein
VRHKNGNDVGHVGDLIEGRSLHPGQQGGDFQFGHDMPSWFVAFSFGKLESSSVILSYTAWMFIGSMARSSLSPSARPDVPV